MVLYNKEFCPSVLLALKCLNDILLPPRVYSSAGVKRSLTSTAINPFKILYRLVSLKFFLLNCKLVQPRSWIGAVTLDLRSGFVIRAESLVVTTFLKCGCPPDFLVVRMPLEGFA